MELGLKGKVVVITGGTAGIGAAVAIGFCRKALPLAVCAEHKRESRNSIRNAVQQALRYLLPRLMPAT